MPSIYEQIGGDEAIQIAVEIFYRKVLADDSIAHFFDDIDMDKQLAKQASFLTMVTGGPNEYTGHDMRVAHRHLVARGLNRDHFESVVVHLGATLMELKVPDEIVEQIIATAQSVQDDVLNR